MNWDESLFHAINGMAGQSATLDWIMVELAKPGNLLFPMLWPPAYWFGVNWRECLIGCAMLAGVIGATDALGTQLKGWFNVRVPASPAEVQQLLGCGGAFSFPSNHAANTAAGCSVFPSPVSQIRLDLAGPWWLAIGYFPRLHRRPLSDGCDRGVGRGWNDWGWRGLVSVSVVSLSSGSHERHTRP